MTGRRAAAELFLSTFQNAVTLYGFNAALRNPVVQAARCYYRGNL